MDFSIVIPLYNKAEYITKTLRSVMMQTYPRFEVLVVDDGSTDKSLEVVRSLSQEDARIKVITQSNQGVSSARNTGIRAAQYELIALLDGDDWWDTRYLEEMVGLIQEYPSVSVYSTQCALVYQGAPYPSKEILAENAKKTACFDCFQIGITLKYLPYNSSCIIIRKGILQQTELFDERISFFEDQDLFIRICALSQLAYIEKGPLSFYNKDIPDDRRTTGQTPALEKHLLYYTEKFEPYYALNPNLRVFLSIFTLNGLYDLRFCSNYKSFKREKLKNIPLKMFSLHHLIKYYCPGFVTDFLRKVYLWAKKSPYS